MSHNGPSTLTCPLFSPDEVCLCFLHTFISSIWPFSACDYIYLMVPHFDLNFEREVKTFSLEY